MHDAKSSCNREPSVLPCARLHARRRRDAQKCQAVAHHLLYGNHERKPGVAQLRIRNDELFGVVIGMKGVSKLAQIVDESVRRARDGAALEHLGVARDLLQYEL